MVYALVMAYIMVSLSHHSISITFPNEVLPTSETTKFEYLGNAKISIKVNISADY